MTTRLLWIQGAPVPISAELLTEAFRMDARLRAIRALVDEQAEDEGLWFIAATAAEAYLQQELRRLHALIEAGEDE